MRWLPRALRRKRAPESADALLRDALLAVLARDLERAESLLAEAVRRDAKSVEPYLALGRLYRMRGEIGRAIRIDQNLLLRSDLSREQTLAALEDLAQDFKEGGFLQRAVASYEEVLARDARHRGALRALVSLLASVRDFPRALEMARRLARVSRPGEAAGVSDEADLWVESARAAQAEGRSTDARRAARRALRRDPRRVSAWVVLGEIEAERGRTRAALAAWAKVPALDRHSGPLVYTRLEATYAALDQARGFEDFLAGLLAERPDDPHARFALARALAARGEIEEAIAMLRGLLARDPDDLAVRGALGRLLLAEQRETEALKEYAELLDVLERHGMLHRREELS